MFGDKFSGELGGGSSIRDAQRFRLASITWIIEFGLSICECGLFLLGISMKKFLLVLEGLGGALLCVAIPRGGVGVILATVDCEIGLLSMRT